MSPFTALILIAFSISVFIHFLFSGLATYYYRRGWRDRSEAMNPVRRDPIVAQRCERLAWRNAYAKFRVRGFGFRKSRKESRAL